MRNNNSTATKGGMGFGIFIFLVLLILKATGNIAMHWGWVLTSFIWAPVLAGIVILVGIGIIAIIAAAIARI
jgi:hypothetical protein